MRFLLRATFWLGLVLVLLPNSGSQPVPKLQVSTSEAFSAAKGVVTDIQNFCERQQEACMVGSRTPLHSASVRKRVPECSMSFSASDSDRMSLDPCESWTRFRYLPQDPRCRHCGRRIRAALRQATGIIIERSMAQ